MRDPQDQTMYTNDVCKLALPPLLGTGGLHLRMHFLPQIPTIYFTNLCVHHVYVQFVTCSALSVKQDKESSSPPSLPGPNL